MSSETWGLDTPFWIDTDAYSDRDRLMFVCGVEFEMVCRLLESGNGIARPIHSENESRIRMLCGKRQRPCKIEPNGDGTWSHLEVAPDLREGKEEP